MSCPSDGHCITCSDEGVPMVLTAAGDALAACRDRDGAVHEVALDLVGPLGAGEHVLVHAGVAIARLEVPA